MDELTSIFRLAEHDGVPNLWQANQCGLQILRVDVETVRQNDHVLFSTFVVERAVLGHLSEMVRSSQVSAEIEAAAVPLLPGVTELAAQGMVPGGTRRNLTSVELITDFGDIGQAGRVVLADAQTSGGLLLAVAAPLAAALMQALEEEGAHGTVIGQFVARDFADGPSGTIRVH